MKSIRKDNFLMKMIAKVIQVQMAMTMMKMTIATCQEKKMKVHLRMRMPVMKKCMLMKMMTPIRSLHIRMVKMKKLNHRNQR